MSRGVWAWCVGLWVVFGCGPVRSEAECAPEWGAACADVGTVPGAGPACAVGEAQACEAGCAGVRTCGAGGAWGPCQTCGEGQRCEGRQCVCDPASCADGCCQENTCVPGTASNACGAGGQACVACPGPCDARGRCVACTTDAHCAGATSRCDLGTGTCVCAKSEPSESQCGDGRDNDCDGLVDCADPDCAARTCRAAAGVCDQEEVCRAGVCPGDGRVGPEVVCRPSRGGCDVEERCDGLGAACPADRKVAAGSVCLASTGACDPAELCDGVSPACPADRYLPAGQVCRAVRGECDRAARCSGTSALCPANPVDNARCDDGRSCTLDICAAPSGTCVHEQVGFCR